MLTNLLAIVPVTLLFSAAYAAARPNPKRVRFASWTLCVMAGIIGTAIPCAMLFRMVSAATMSAGTSSGISIVTTICTILPALYFLWFAVSIYPSAAPFVVRGWDILMHFVYAPVSLLAYSFMHGTGMSLVLLIVGITVASLVGFWYRLIDLQQKTQNA